MNFSIVSCVAYFVHLFKCRKISSAASLEILLKLCQQQLSVHEVNANALVVLFITVQLMNGYIKVQKFNLSFLIQMCYLAGDHLFKNVQLLLKAI